MFNKKVLITGATGFIGSHLTELCVENGYSVKAFDRYNPNNHWGWLEDSSYKSEIEVILGDIRDYDSVYNSMKGCDVVFHLAALIGIPYSYISPLAYIRTNIEGTYNVLEAARRLESDDILITSTSETYGTAQYTPIDENHPMVAQSPYSASKIAADQMALSYHRAFGCPVKIVRPFNTYGPRQSARAVIPTIISQLLIGTEELRLGSITPTRDLVFVKDACHGFIAIHNSDKLVGEVTNIGMNKEISVGDLAQRIVQLMGKKTRVGADRERIRPESSEVNQLMCNNSKLLKHTSWKPHFTLESGLKETVNWMESNIDLYKSEIYNV
jgi:NAD dependent epimerase/dehydratase